MKKQIAIFSTSRADYSHLYWLIEKIKIEKSFNCSLYISGSHLEKKLGNISALRIEAIRDFNPDHTTPVTTIRIGLLWEY